LKADFDYDVVIIGSGSVESLLNPGHRRKARQEQRTGHAVLTRPAWSLRYSLIGHAGADRRQLRHFDFELSTDELVQIDGLDTGIVAGADPDTFPREDWRFDTLEQQSPKGLRTGRVQRAAIPTIRQIADRLMGRRMAMSTSDKSRPKPSAHQLSGHRLGYCRWPLPWPTS
jgi:hypothetical protein